MDYFSKKIQYAIAARWPVHTHVAAGCCVPASYKHVYVKSFFQRTPFKGKLFISSETARLFLLLFNWKTFEYTVAAERTLNNNRRFSRGHLNWLHFHRFYRSLRITVERGQKTLCLRAHKNSLLDRQALRPILFRKHNGGQNEFDDVQIVIARYE